MASLAFISKSLGLSKATVSRAFDLRFSDMVKPETRKRIYEFCQQHNYHPSIIGRSFSTGKTFKLGIIPAGTEKHFSLFFSTFFYGVTIEAIERNYTPMILNFDQNPEYYTNLIKSSVADAFIVNSFNNQEGLLELLRQKQLPVIIFDQYNRENCDLPVFFRDLKPAYSRLWQNLAPEYQNKTAFVWRGFVPGKWQDLQDAAPPGTLIGNIEISSKKEHFLLHRDSARLGAEKILDRLLKYKLLWCSSDMVALGICDTLRKHGIEPGKDIFIVGFDNLEATVEDFSEPLLTTIDPGWNNSGRQVTKMLLDALDSNTPLPPRTQWVPEVIFRDTFPQKKDTIMQQIKNSEIL